MIQTILLDLYPLFTSKTIEDEMQRQAEEFAVKKQHGEETINQLIQEVELTSIEGKKLMESRKKIKKGK